MEDLLHSLHQKGLVTAEASLDDILSLGVEEILNRRLQAQVYYKGWPAPSSRHANSSPTDKSSSVSRR